MKLIAGVIVLFTFAFTLECHQLAEKFSWRDVEFAWPTNDIRQEALLDGKYVPSNNLPLAFDVWRDKIFLTVPRCVCTTTAAVGRISIVIYDNL